MQEQILWDTCMPEPRLAVAGFLGDIYNKLTALEGQFTNKR